MYPAASPGMTPAWKKTEAVFLSSMVNAWALSLLKTLSQAALFLEPIETGSSGGRNTLPKSSAVSFVSAGWSVVCKPRTRMLVRTGKDCSTEDFSTCIWYIRTEFFCIRHEEIWYHGFNIKFFHSCGKSNLQTWRWSQLNSPGRWMCCFLALIRSSMEKELSLLMLQSARKECWTERRNAGYKNNLSRPVYRSENQWKIVVQTVSKGYIKN